MDYDCSTEVVRVLVVKLTQILGGLDVRHEERKESKDNFMILHGNNSGAELLFAGKKKHM